MIKKYLSLKPISFEVNNGDRVAIIGKNGIGKVCTDKPNR